MMGGGGGGKLFASLVDRAASLSFFYFGARARLTFASSLLV
jgi:hypothetical protein